MPSATEFARAGRLQAAYDAVDWAATPLGAPGSWSTALRTSLELALATRFPVALMWGPELVLLYDEAFVELIDDEHPDALGGVCTDVFAEAWDVIGPMFRSVLAGEGSTWVEDAHVPLHRRGFLEECYSTISYSPMGQVRNLLRGIGHTLGDPPGLVLSALDRSLHDLGVAALATCVLATLEQDEHDAAEGVRRLRWSSAGHLPPLVVHADGSAELLVREPDLLLGLDPAVRRADHATVLHPGDTGSSRSPPDSRARTWRDCATACWPRSAQRGRTTSWSWPSVRTRRTGPARRRPARSGCSRTSGPCSPCLALS